jgi:hypothetical protein
MAQNMFEPTKEKETEKEREKEEEEIEKDEDWHEPYCSICQSYYPGIYEDWCIDTYYSHERLALDDPPLCYCCLPCRLVGNKWRCAVDYVHFGNLSKFQKDVACEYEKFKEPFCEECQSYYPDIYNDWCIDDYYPHYKLKRIRPPVCYCNLPCRLEGNKWRCAVDDVRLGDLSEFHKGNACAFEEIKKPFCKICQSYYPKIYNDWCINWYYSHDDLAKILPPVCRCGWPCCLVDNKWICAVEWLQFTEYDGCCFERDISMDPQ